MSPKKLNDVELSALLTAHAAGHLKVGGASLAATGEYTDFMTNVPANCGMCINQAVIPNKIGRFCARALQTERADWFDRNYEFSWSVDQFLLQLEAAGIA